MLITGVAVDQREDAVYVTVFTASGFRVWLVSERGERTLLEDVAV